MNKTKRAAAQKEQTGPEAFKKEKAGLNADLAQFKDQFTKSQTDLNDERQKLRIAERDARQLTAERDQLKTSVTNWAAAVATRDERLNQAIAQIRRLGGELNSSIRKFNELASNHNAVVKDLNDLRSRPAQPKPQQQEPVRDPKIP